MEDTCTSPSISTFSPVSPSLPRIVFLLDSSFNSEAQASPRVSSSRTSPSPAWLPSLGADSGWAARRTNEASTVSTENMLSSSPLFPFPRELANESWPVNLLKYSPTPIRVLSSLKNPSESAAFDPFANPLAEPNCFLGLLAVLLNLLRLLTWLRFWYEAAQLGSLATWRISQALRERLGFDAAGESVPSIGDPASTASTAAWHLVQLPDQSNPTDPLIGFTIRPQASYSSDLNIANNSKRKANSKNKI